MKTSYTRFREELKPFPLFSVREIEKYFPGFDSRRLVEWQRKGYIRKLRNRYYSFDDQPVDEGFLSYAANQLYSPSYLSLESALSFYGFIPEGVFQFTSCTTRKTQTFDTPVGSFSYRRLKPPLYFGYLLQTWGDHHYKIAEPEKALIDYLYLHHELEEARDLEALRWNRHEIRNRISADRLSRYATHIGSPALDRRITLLQEFLHADD
ncbi:MAG: hypothetical protein WD355_07610 [Balneolaceae bacterium]